MSNDQSPPDNPVPVSTDAPEWMSGEVSDWRAELAHYEPELAVAYAAFAEFFPNKNRTESDGTIIDPANDERAHLFQLLMATWYNDVHTLADWQEEIASYPVKSLKDMKDKPKSKRCAITARAHYLNMALTRLLGLVGAPQSVIADVDYILGLHMPRSAKIREQAQRALIDAPNASLREIAGRLPTRIDKYGKERPRDHGQVSKDIKSGRIVRPKAPKIPRDS